MFLGPCRDFISVERGSAFISLLLRYFVSRKGPLLCAEEHGGSFPRHGPETAARGTRFSKNTYHDIGIAELDPWKQCAIKSDTEESDAEGASTSDTEESDAEAFPFRFAGWFG